MRLIDADSFLTKQEAIDNLMSFKPDCEVLYE